MFAKNVKNFGRHHITTQFGREPAGRTRDFRAHAYGRAIARPQILIKVVSLVRSGGNCAGATTVQLMIVASTGAGQCFVNAGLDIALRLAAYGC